MDCAESISDFWAGDGFNPDGCWRIHAWDGGTSLSGTASFRGVLMDETFTVKRGELQGTAMACGFVLDDPLDTAWVGPDSMICIFPRAIPQVQ